MNDEMKIILKNIHEKLASLDDKVDDLNKFKWTTVGLAMCGSSIVTVLLTVFFKGGV